MAALSWIAELLQFDRDGDDFCIREPRRGATERLFGGLIAAFMLVLMARRRALRRQARLGAGCSGAGQR